MLKTSDKFEAAALAIPCALLIVLQNGVAETLPFDPANISRLSVDEIPRSISIRQGTGIWFGYDLEKARVFKVWTAPEDKPGLIRKDFKTRSQGTVLFEAKTDEGWRIARDGKTIPLKVRYLGCTENEESFELRWELGHPGGTLELSERIPTALEAGSSGAIRKLRVESLEEGASLILPSAYRETWSLTGPDGTLAKSITETDWYRLSLR